jgi:predicted enzyme related to lactoylglutathione lyase
MLAVAALGLACSSGSQKDVRPLVPAVATTGSPVYRPGSFVWFDLLVDDAAAVRPFYEGLFGWSFHTTDGSGQYLAIQHDGRVTAGMSVSGDAAADDHRGVWLSSVSVTDVDKISVAAEAAGGSVVLDPRDLPDRGRYSVIKDPQGAAVVLLRSSTGDGIRRSPEALQPGDFLWTELWTSDLGAAREFYSGLLGYGIEFRSTRSAEEGASAAPASGEDSSGYLILTRDGERKAGMAQLPFEDATPHWLPFVAVGDVYASVERVRQLGGEVIVGPDLVGRHDAAIIVDPSGAVFGLQQWPRPSLQGGDQ